MTAHEGSKVVAMLFLDAIPSRPREFRPLTCCNLGTWDIAYNMAIPESSTRTFGSLALSHMGHDADTSEMFPRHAEPFLPQDNRVVHN
jgi:hypothetical protein